MLKIIISGCNGHMGRVVAALCAADSQVEVVAGLDVMGSTDREFPVYTSPAQFTGQDRGKIDPEAALAMVTPREVDRMIGHAAKFISLAVNKALYPQLSLEEISFLCA